MTWRAFRAALLAGIGFVLAAPPASAFLGFSEIRGSLGVTSTGDLEGAAWLDNGRRGGLGLSREFGRRTELRLDARTSQEDFAPEGPIEIGDATSLRAGAGLRRHAVDGMFRWVFAPTAWGFFHLDAGAQFEYREVRDDGGPREVYRAIGPAAALGVLVEGSGRRIHASAGYARWFVDGASGGEADDGQADRFFARAGIDVRVAPALGVGLGMGADRLRFQPPAGSTARGLAWGDRGRYLPWTLLGEARLIVRLP